MIYFIIPIILLFLIYFYDYRQNQFGKMVWFCVMLLVLVLVAGLRYRIGTDSIRYEIYFQRYPDLSNLSLQTFQNSRFSPLYIVLNSAVRSITNEFYIFQLVHAAIINSVIFYFFYKNCRHVFLAVLIYYLTLYILLNTEVLREALAACVFLLAWPAYKNNKWIVWYICSFIAFLFHVSAIFMFLVPLIALPGVRSLFIFGKRTIIICAVLFVIAGVINVFLFRYLQSLAMIENLAERATVYSKSDLATAKLNFKGIIGLFFVYVVYPLMALYALNVRRKREGKNPYVFDKFESLTILSVYVSIMGSGIFIFQRYQDYLLFFPMVTIADYMFSRLVILGRSMRIGFISWFIFICPLFLINFYVTYPRNVNPSGTLKTYMTYYPYSSVLNPKKDPDREKVFKYNHVH